MSFDTNYSTHVLEQEQDQYTYNADAFARDLLGTTPEATRARIQEDLETQLFGAWGGHHIDFAWLSDVRDRLFDDADITAEQRRAEDERLLKDLIARRGAEFIQQVQGACLCDAKFEKQPMRYEVTELSGRSGVQTCRGFIGID